MLKIIVNKQIYQINKLLVIYRMTPHLEIKAVHILLHEILQAPQVFFPSSNALLDHLSCVFNGRLLESWSPSSEFPS